MAGERRQNLGTALLAFGAILLVVDLLARRLDWLVVGVLALVAGGALAQWGMRARRRWR